MFMERDVVVDKLLFQRLSLADVSKLLMHETLQLLSTHFQGRFRVTTLEQWFKICIQFCFLSAIHIHASQLLFDCFHQ